MPETDPRIVNPVFRTFWAGWRSDTVTLARNGWQISAEQAVDRFAIRFIIKHPNYHVYGISEMAELAYRDLRLNSQDFGGNPFVMPGVELPFQLCSELIINYADPEAFHARFDLIDAEPTIVTHEPTSIEDMKLFPPQIVPVENQIIVDPHNVPKLLDIVLEHQSPQQKEIRERLRRQRRRDERMGRKIHAEIISFTEKVA